jgi:glutathione reductase (NADPH)
MAREFDVVVIGAGTAAMGVATRVRSAGWSVAVVDFRPFGGTCALRGCDPKKMLISGTSAILKKTVFAYPTGASDIGYML